MLALHIIVNVHNTSMKVLMRTDNYLIYTADIRLPSNGLLLLLLLLFSLYLLFFFFFFFFFFLLLLQKR